MRPHIMRTQSINNPDSNCYTCESGELQPPGEATMADTAKLLVEEAPEEMPRTLLAKVKDPRSNHHRILFLFLLCCVRAGYSITYDVPAALHKHITSELRIGEAAFMQLYSWQCWSNVVLSLCGGFVLDRITGVRLGTIICTSFTLVGQLVFAVGIAGKQVWMLDVGEFVYGVGHVTLYTAMGSFSVLWFPASINIVLSIQVAVEMLMKTSCLSFSELIYNKVGLTSSAFIAVTPCLFSVVVAMLIGFLDKRAERMMQRTITTTRNLAIKDVANFSSSMWLLFVVTVAFDGVLYTFIPMGKNLLEDKYHLSAEDASVELSSVYLITACLSPLFGSAVHKLRNEECWVVLMIVLMQASLALFAFFTINPWVPIILLGISSAIGAFILESLVSYVVPSDQLSAGYGLIMSADSLGNAAFSNVVGVIFDTKGHLTVLLFFSLCCSVGLCAALLFWWKSRLRGHHHHEYIQNK